jgi:hypothetical protein
VRVVRVFLMAIATVAGIGAGGAQAAHRPDNRWPVSICAPQSGPRFITTTLDQDPVFGPQFMMEPVAKSVRPRTTTRQAMRNFHEMYGPTTAAEDRHTQIRYGLVTNLLGGVASANAIDYVPMARRSRGWVVTDCDASSPPKGQGLRRRPATLVFVVADTPKPKSWGWIFQPKDHSKFGDSGPDDPFEHPRARKTPFFSAPWRIVARKKNGDVLLRYRTRPCYTFDHLTLEGTGKDRIAIAVILSSGPGRACPRPSATSPYAEVGHVEDRTTRRPQHLRTGMMPFRPESS